MYSAFWSHFITLQLVVEHILAIELTPELTSAIGARQNLSPLISVSRSTLHAGHVRPSSFDSDEAANPDVPLIADCFLQLPDGVAGLSDPFQIVGFRAFAVVSWMFRPGYPFSVLLVHTEDSSDVVTVRSVFVAEDVTGVRLTASLAHPPDIPLTAFQTRDGVVYAATRDRIPPDFAIIPITSGDFQSELEMVSLKSRFVIMTELMGAETLETMQQVTEELYHIQCHDPGRLIGLVAGRTCECLVKLGLLRRDHPRDELDWAVLAGLNGFQQRLTDGQSPPCERLCPGLLQTLEEYTTEWEAALLCPVFGYLADSPADLWQFTTSLIQAYKGLSITGWMDQSTVKFARSLIQWVLGRRIAGPARQILTRVL
jgi:hypothetical protein